MIAFASSFSGIKKTEVCEVPVVETVVGVVETVVNVVEAVVGVSDLVVIMGPIKQEHLYSP